MSLLTRLGVRVAGSLIGRRPGLNFVPGTGISIGGADSPSNGRVDVTISATGGGGGSGSAPAAAGFTLNGVHNVGVTTVTVNEAIPALYNNASFVIALDGYGTSCECVGVASASGSVFTLDRPLRIQHASGARVLANPAVNADLYGITSNGSTDDWRPIQRQIIENRSVATKGWSNVTQTIFGPQIGGAGSLWARTSFPVIQTNIADPDGYLRSHNAVFQSCDGAAPFTATNGSTVISYDNTQATPDLGNFNAVGYPVAFNAPYGETLPGGIVAGKYYRLLSANTTTHQITIADYSAPSTPITFSSSGSGWMYANFGSLSQFFASIQVWVDAAFPNLDGIHISCQQPSRADNLRCTYDPSTGTGCGIYITGQYGEFTNMMLSVSTEVDATGYGLLIRGTGFYFDYITYAGRGKAAVQDAAQDTTIVHLQCENGGTSATSGLEIGGSRNFTLGKGFFSGGGGAKGVYVSAASSYDIGMLRTAASERNLFTCGVTGVTLDSWDGADWSAVGDSDRGLSIPGVSGMNGGIYAHYPHIKGRTQRVGPGAAANGPFKLRLIDLGYAVNCAAASGEVWLARGYPGVEQYVVKDVSSSNTLTVKDASGTTLDTITGVKKAITYLHAGSGWVKKSEVTL